jgi:signal peptidase I
VDAAAHRAPRLRARPALLAGVVVVALLIAADLFAAEPFRIPSSSMEPTLRPGDSVLVDKLSYRGGGTPRRGQLVAFKEPASGGVLLKRVVGVGGDHVAIEDGVLVVNGRRPVEPYANPKAIDSVYFGPVRVPRHSVFVLGDNRGDSRDSRAFGAVPRHDVIGRVVARIWPPGRWDAPR